MADDPNINEDDLVMVPNPTSMEVVFNIGNHINRLIDELNSKGTSFLFRSSVSSKLKNLRKQFLTLLERFYYISQLDFAAQEKELKIQFEQWADYVYKDLDHVGKWNMLKSDLERVEKQLEDVEKKLEFATIDTITKKTQTPLLGSLFGPSLNWISIPEYKIDVNIPIPLLPFMIAGMETSDFDIIHEIEDTSQSLGSFSDGIVFAGLLIGLGSCFARMLCNPWNSEDSFSFFVRHFAWILFAGVMVWNGSLFTQISRLRKLNQGYDKLRCQVREMNGDDSYRMIMQRRCEAVLEPSTEFRNFFSHRLINYLPHVTSILEDKDRFLMYLSTHPEYSRAGLYLTAFATIINFIMLGFVHYQERIVPRKRQEINSEFSDPPR